MYQMFQHMPGSIKMFDSLWLHTNGVVLAGNMEPGVQYKWINVWNVNQNISNVSVGSKCINFWDWNLRHCLSNIQSALKAKKFLINYKKLLCPKLYCVWKWMKLPKLVPITQKMKKKINAKKKRIQILCRQTCLWGHERCTQRNCISKKT